MPRRAEKQKYGWMSLIVTAEIFENDDIYQKEKARKKVVEKMSIMMDILSVELRFLCTQYKTQNLNLGFE